MTTITPTKTMMKKRQQIKNDIEQCMVKFDPELVATARVERNQTKFTRVIVDVPCQQYSDMEACIGSQQMAENLGNFLLAAIKHFDLKEQQHENIDYRTL